MKRCVLRMIDEYSPYDYRESFSIDALDAGVGAGGVLIGNALAHRRGVMMGGLASLAVIASRKVLVKFPITKEELKQEGCVLLLLMNEGQGSTLEDKSGNNNSALISGASWIGGLHGKALYFNGLSNYAYVSKNFTEGLTGITIEAVVNGEKDSSIAFTDGGILRLFFGGSYGFGLTAQDGTDSGYLSWDSQVPVNTWVRLAATWSNGVMKLYQNGVKQSTEKAFAGGLTGKLKASSILRIGYEWSSGFPWFKGGIDEVRLYARELTESELRTHSEADSK